MSVPKYDPGKYLFNPEDDRRATAGGVGEAYRALASAYDEMEDALLQTGRPYVTYPPKLQTTMNTARNAIARAGFQLVMHYGRDEDH